MNNASAGKMFGAHSLKASNGNTAAFFWKNSMVFKLDEQSRQDALQLSGVCVGSHIYAPDRKMTGWISIPTCHADNWTHYASKAIEFVSTLK
ncbi:MAG: hypothetical protein V3U76_17600 [Granulosicoccus sp.]